VRLGIAAGLLCAALACACGGAPPPPAPPPQPVEPAEAAPEEPAADEPPPVVDAPERSRPPSTATYEQATSTPESLDVHDERAHLTDAQLTGPMRGVMNACRIPPNAKVTVKTAVQNGRAIGVTVNVRIDRPKSKRPPSKAALKAEVKTSAKIAACVDRAVRKVVWPPSSRRDSFTTEF
jgi:hypothetical protein